MLLDGRKVKNEGHDYLMEQLDFPSYYGKNLDALFDCLCGMKLKIQLKNADEMSADMLETFKDAEKENEYLTLEYI